MAGSRLINRNVIGAGGRTSMRLEPELWQALGEIAARERTDLGGLIRGIESRSNAGGRTSAVRVFIVEYLRAALNASLLAPTRLAKDRVEAPLNRNMRRSA